MAHLQPDDLYFTAHSTEELRALRDLGGRSMLQLVGDIDSSDIRDGLLPDQLRKLVIRDNNVLRDLRFLPDQRCITSIDLSCGSPYVDDLAPARRAAPGMLSLDALPGLAEAGCPGAALGLERPCGCWTSAFRCTATPSTPLSPGICRWSICGSPGTLSGSPDCADCADTRTLKQLSLATLPEKLTPEDFEEIARLPALEELRVNWNAVGWSAGPVLPNITRLRLNMFTGSEDLSKVPVLFPRPA